MLCVLISLFSPILVFGDGFLDETLSYSIKSSSEVDVTGLKDRSSTDVCIPKTVKYEYYDYDDLDDEGNAKVKYIIYKVTGIGNRAFEDCSSLASVTIGYSVTSIGVGAFYGCSSLENVMIPDSVTSIGGAAFYGCSSLESVTIPNSVTSIGNYVFHGCSSLENVMIPDSVTSIGAQAFHYCSSPASVTIPNSVTSIGNCAFGGCSSLESVRIPDSVTSIGGTTFSGCSSLKNVMIPDSVTSIGGSAFSRCSSLKNVMIPDSVTSIGNLAFWDCSSLESVTIPDGVTSIGDQAFWDCSSLKSVTIGDSVTSVGESAFSGTNIDKVYITDLAKWCNIEFNNEYSNPLSGGVNHGGANLYLNGDLVTSLIIPNSVSRIGDWTFSYCRSIESVTIPDSVKSIGYCAFGSCSSLASVTIGYSVTSIGVGAFYGCSSLKNVMIPDSVTSIGDRAFRGCGLESVTIGDGVVSIGEWAFSATNIDKVYITDLAKWCNIEFDDEYSNPLRGGANLYLNGILITSLIIPNSVTSIGDFAFFGCDSLESVAIPNSVTSIGDFAFEDCSSLTSITIGDGVTNIGDYAFYSCNSLESVAIPNSVTSIGDFAFLGCSSLTHVTISDSVTSVGDEAFHGWDVNFVFEGRAPVSVGDRAFCYVNSNCRGYYKPEHREAWMAVIDEDGMWNDLIMRMEGGYVVRFNQNGDDDFPVKNEMAEQIFVIGKEQPLAKNLFEREGFDFGGWATYPQSVAAWYKDEELVKNLAEEGDEVDLYAFWIPKQVTITFQDDRENHKKYTVYKWSVGSTIHNVPIHRSTEARFLGWFLPGSDERIELGVTRVPSRDTTYNARWEERNWDSGTDDDGIYEPGEGECLVTFDPNGGLLPSDEMAYMLFFGAELGEIGELPEPTKDGCTFLGWWSDPEGGTQITVSTIVEGSATYYAHWSNGDNKFEWNEYNGEITISKYIGVEAVVNIPAEIEGCPVTAIGYEAFYGCDLLESVVLPDSVVEIGYEAFCGCTSLTNVVLGSGVKYISSGAFAECTSLAKIDLPDALKEISYSLFYGCTSLRDVKLGNNVERIGAYAFAGTGVTELALPDSVAYIGSCAFVGSLLEEINVPSALEYLGGYVFAVTPWLEAQGDFVVYGDFLIYYQGEDAEVTIPETVRVICEGAFESTPVESVHIPDSVTDIEPYAFSYAEDLSTVTGGANVRYVGFESFLDTALWEDAPMNAPVRVGSMIVGYKGELTEALIIPDGVTVIGDNAFCGCTNITSVTLPVSVKAINDWAFADCENLEDVVFAGARDDIEMDVFYAFDGTPWLKNKAFDPPENDDLANAATLTGKSGSVTATNIGATFEDVDDGIGLGDATIWWKWTAPEDGTVTFDTFGSGFDTVLAVGEINDGFLVDGYAYNDDSDESDGYESLVEFVAKAGVTYYIVVSGYSDFMGDIVLNWEMDIGDITVDVGGGKSVVVPTEWIDRYGSIVTVAGGDKAAALMRTAANGRKVWECFMLGVDPTKADDDFKITRFWMEGGKPMFEFSHSTDGAGNSFVPRLKVKGKAELSDGWSDVPEGGNSAFRFFTVEVELP